MLNFIKKGIRGGISQCLNRFSKANNKYMHPNMYETSLPSKHILYLDANNLYGYAMSNYLTTNKFKWSTNKEIDCLEF